MDDMNGVGYRLKDYHRPVKSTGFTAPRTANLVLLFGMAAVLCQFIYMRYHLGLSFTVNISFHNPSSPPLILRGGINLGFLPAFVTPT
jgi:hypothetical protein